MNYHNKYLKYKNKYINLKNILYAGMKTSATPENSGKSKPPASVADGTPAVDAKNHGQKN